MRKEFEVHRLNERGMKANKAIAADFDFLLAKLEESHCLPSGREMSIVRTKLEEACFFAKKCNASRIDMQEPSE